MEIEVEYLWGLHDRLLHQEDDEENFQLKVLSHKPVNRTFYDISLTDFYVLVADNINNVRYGRLKDKTFEKDFIENNCFILAPQKHQIDKFNAVIQRRS